MSTPNVYIRLDEIDIIKDEGENTDTLSYLRPLIESMVDKLDASEVTITFKQSWRDNLQNHEIIRMIERYFRFLPLTYIREVLLVPEYGANRNLHFHGILRGKVSDMSELKIFLNRRFGRSTISAIQCPAHYGEYIMKEQEDTDINDIIHFKYNNEENTVHFGPRNLINRPKAESSRGGEPLVSVNPNQDMGLDSGIEKL